MSDYKHRAKHKAVIYRPQNHEIHICATSMDEFYPVDLPNYRKGVVAAIVVIALAVLALWLGYHAGI